MLAGEKRISDIIIPNIRPGLDLAPSNIRLSDMELTLVNVRFRETKLRRALEPVIPRYDYLFLDCPPNLGLLTVNALIAADFVIIPAASDYLSNARCLAAAQDHRHHSDRSEPQPDDSGSAAHALQAPNGPCS